MARDTLPPPDRVAELVVEASPDLVLVGRRVPLAGERLCLGRDPGCELAIQDRAVSRRHAEVRQVDGTWVLVDLGSANGVWVGTQRVAEHPLADGDRFRLGATVLAFHLADAPTSPVDPDRVATLPPIRLELPPAPARGRVSSASFVPEAQLGERLEDALRRWGKATQVSGNTPWVIEDARVVWFVAEGQVELFTLALDETGAPAGARTHFLTVRPGELIFGMDFRRFGLGGGILAVGKGGTTVVELEVAQLRVLARQERFGHALAQLVDRWVQGLSEAFALPLGGGPTPDVLLDAGREVEVASGATGRSGREVVWLEVLSGDLLFVGWEPLQRERADAEREVGLGDLFDSLARLRALFPLAPQVWVEAANPDGSPSRLRAAATAQIIASPGLWTGLALFHEVLCHCEFINKRLSLVDELNRLRSKAAYAEAAGREAERAIAGVMAEAGGTPGLTPAPTGKDPLLEAAALVGQALGMVVKDHPEVDRRADFVDRINAIAKASRFRTRPVALRDDWYRGDQGPLLGRWEEGGSPVALLPVKGRAYQYVDPATGARGQVDEGVAARLSPFGMVFYRPFPDGPLSAREMVRFGARGLRGDLLMLLAMGVGLGLLGSVTPYFTGRLFDTAIPQADRSLLLQFVAGLLVAALVSSAFKITQAVAVLRIQGKMDYSIQAALWDRLLNLPSNTLRRYTAGDLADRAAGIDQIRKLMAGAGINSILGALSSVFYVFLMVSYSLLLAAVGVGLTLVYVGITTLANYLRLRQERQEMTLRGALTGMVLEFITGVPKIRVAGAENHAFRVWAMEYSRQRRLLFRIGQIKNAVQVFSAGFPVLSSLVIFYALMQIQQAALAKGQPPTITTGDFIAFNAAFVAFLTALQSLGDASLDMLRVVPTYERLKPIVTEPAELDEARAYPGRLRGEVQVSHVSFRYSEDGPWILNDLSVHIKPGEFVAFVGASGCGKSTLMRVLLGFETPTRGAVYYDGQDLATLDLREVRQQIGVVLQNSTLLPTDIYRNIVGSSGLSVSAAWEAAALAGLAEDIQQLPMGMHTYISEGGGGFSGGQRQKVLIARALVRKPRIMIFDEATSALDNRSQAVVMESIEKLQATRIVIAHRLSTIINADRICYLEGGRVLEEGTFAELMAKDGKFAALARRQMA